MSMAKRKISQWWFAGLAAMFPAGVLIPSSALALAARQGGDGVRDGYGRAMLALIVLGGLCALARERRRAAGGVVCSSAERPVTPGQALVQRAAVGRDRGDPHDAIARAGRADLR